MKFDTPLTAEGMTKAVIVLRRLGDASASRDTQIILADSNNTVVGSNVSITFDTTAPMSSAVTVTIDLTDGWTDIAGFACIVAGDSTNNYWNALYIESITFAA